MTACASQFNAEFKTPSTPSVAPTSASQPSAHRVGNTDSGISKLYWKRFYVDQELRRLITAALEHNRDLRQALLRVDEVRASHDIQSAESYPKINAGGQFARARTPADLSVSGSPQVKGQHEMFVGLSSWEIDLWGRVRSLNEAALQNYLATEAGQRATQAALIHQVAKSYVAARGLDARLALARKSMWSREQSLHIFNRRVEVGAMSRYALSQAKTLLYQAQMMGLQLEQQRTLLDNALEQLTGQPLKVSQFDFDNSSLLLPLPESVPADIVVNRPDIVAAEHSLKSAQANVSVARAAFLPRIMLMGRAGTASAQLDGLFALGSDAWQFTPSITLPIFDGGALQANYNLQSIRQNMAVVEYEKRIETAMREVRDAIASRSSFVAQEHVLQEQFNGLSERNRLAHMRFDNGASPYLEVLDAERDMLNAEQQLLQGRENLLLAQIDLYKAVGGGSSLVRRPYVPSVAASRRFINAEVSP